MIVSSPLTLQTTSILLGSGKFETWCGVDKSTCVGPGGILYLTMKHSYQ